MATYTFTLRNGITLSDAKAQSGTFDIDDALTAGAGTITTTDDALAAELRSKLVWNGSANVTLLIEGGVIPGAPPPDRRSNVPAFVQGDEPTARPYLWEKTTGGVPNGARQYHDGTTPYLIVGAASNTVQAAAPTGTAATDSAAFTAALALLGGTPGRISLARGGYVLNSNVMVFDTGQYVSGQGVEATIVKLADNEPGPLLSSAGFAAKTGTSSTATPFNFGWSNMTLDGNKAHAPAAMKAPPNITGVAVNGTPGTTVWTYIATAIGASGGESVWSNLGSVTTGNGVLDGTNNNTITLGATPSNGWNLYRCVTAGGDQIELFQRVNSTPIAGSTYTDVGAALQAAKPPYSDTTCKPTVAIYGYGWRASDFVIRNGVGTGLWTEWASSSVSPGNDSMEAFLRDFKIHDCAGDGWMHQGPHDSQAVNAIIYANGSSTGYVGHRVVAGSANGSVFSHFHVWGGTYQYGIYAGASGCRFGPSYIVEGGQSAQMWINCAQVQWEGFLYTGGINTASARGIIMGSRGNNSNSCKLQGKIENCGGGAIDMTFGGDLNHIDVAHNYYSGTTPTGSGLGIIGTPTGKNRVVCLVTTNAFVPDTTSLNQQVGPSKIVRTQSGDTRALLDLRDESLNALTSIDAKGRIVGKTGGSTTFAAGANAGSGATVTGASTSGDMSGTLTITTGTTPGAGDAALAAITLATAFGATPNIIVTPANAAARGLAGVGANAATGNWTLFAKDPAASTVYKFSYMLIG